MMKMKKIIKNAAIALLLGTMIGGIGAFGAAYAEEPAGTKSLEGFTCPGASVYIATDGSGTKQMRFQIDLAKEQEEYKGEGKTAGVVVLPYDIYEQRGLTELTKETSGVAIADVTALWEENADGNYSSYAYLDTKLIPAGQENRMLVARGYIEDGENVYYTEEVKASMAYVAWKNYDKMEEYRDVLKTYMGPYTLTYGTGENEKIENLYYGDALTLPEEVGGYKVEAWYWDSLFTQEIKPTDYATGSMQIYYELKKVDVSGNIVAPDGVDVAQTKIFAKGKDMNAVVDASGNFTIRLSISVSYDLVFENGDYIAFADGVKADENGVSDLSVTLKKNTYAVGDYKNFKNSADVTYDKNSALDGVVTVSGTTNSYALALPNVATDESAEYNIRINGYTWNATTSIQNEMYYGFGFTNGDSVLKISFSYWEFLNVNIDGKEIRYLGVNKNNFGGWGYYGRNYKIVRTNEAIKIYVNGNIALTVTQDGITTPSTVRVSLNGENATAIKDLIVENFIGEGKEATLLLCHNSKNSVACGAKYTCSVSKYATVSGTILAPADVDVTATTLKVDGMATPITVQANGTYTATVTEGAHDLLFENGLYVASEEVAFTSGENALNVTLADGTWFAGNYGTVVSNNNPDLNTDATYTVTGQDQLTLFPRTASGEAFEYIVNVSNVQRKSADSGYGIAVSDGKYVLSVFVYESNGGVIANLSSKAGSSHNAFYRNTLTNIRTGGTIKFVVSSEKIEFYAGSDLLFTFTSESFTTSLSSLWNIDSLTANYKTEIAGFFAEGAKIACGISSGFNGVVTATYACAIAKYIPLSGIITAADGVDLTATTLTVDGMPTPITVQSDGSYTADIAEGDHALEFKNGAYFAAEVVTIIKGENSLDVALIDGTWLAGDYGTVVSNNNPELNTDATYTVTGQDQLILFPRTATSEAFEYIVNVSNVQRNSADSGYGIAVSDGKYVLSVFVYESNGAVIANLSNKAGAGYQTFYRNTLTNIRNGGKIKFVVSSEKIEFYAGSDCLFTFTRDGFASSLNNLNWGDTLTSSYKTAIAGFFADGAKIACGISSGFKASVTATYACAIAKYALLSGSITAAEGVDLTVTTLTVDGIATPITVQADGSYVASIAEGTHDLVFESSDYIAFADGVEVSRPGVADINVTLKKNTYTVGDYKNFKSSTNVTYDKNAALDGVVTVSGTASSYALALPNVATTDSAEYNIRITGYTWNTTASVRDEMFYGFGFTNGDSVLKISFSYWEFLNVNIDGKEIRYRGISKDNFGGWGYYGRNYKIVRTNEAIMLYVNDKIALTVTSEGITTPSTVKVALNGSNATAVKDLIVENFIGEGKDATLMLYYNSKSSVACGAKYTCSVTNN